MKTFILYGTRFCHLCELAQGMIDDVGLAADDVQIETVDISDSDILFERYGIRIPVLQHTDLRELEWPFTAVQLRLFLNS
ncbi:MAG: glutaredoxin family protein [Halioglobus sp.]